MHIAFRVDASAALGAGHLMRCATLADLLRARGDTVRFFCRTPPGHQCAWIEERGYRVTRLAASDDDIDQDEDRHQMLAATTEETPFDWLVVDHYRLDARWERALRAVALRILVIDDLADRAHDCDLLVDQNLRASAANPYQDLVPAHARVLLGPRYALLRPAFAALREQLEPRNGTVRRVVLCFGGADPGNHTGTMLDVLADSLGCVEQVDVFAGAACRHRAKLARRCGEFGDRVILHPPSADPASALSRADLALGGGGTMNWERACLGVPTIAFGIADNQRRVLETLIEHAYVLGTPSMPLPDPALMRVWLDVALANPALLVGLARRSLALVDGNGVGRVAQAMLSPAAPIAASLDFRPATLADGENLLAWRNDPAIRAVSLDPREIDPDAHSTWLARSIRNPNRTLLVAEHGGAPVGVVRFDLDGAEAMISVYRAPGVAGRYRLIEQATAWLRREHPAVGRIVAEVLPTNTASLAAFRAAGYREHKSVLVLDLEIS
jgi:UDP-2,4-diacetamido-2,4,6-trideoxy-beta-L-altropyranose hydrolase